MRRGTVSILTLRSRTRHASIKLVPFQEKDVDFLFSDAMFEER